MIRGSRSDWYKEEHLGEIKWVVSNCFDFGYEKLEIKERRVMASP